MSVSHLKSRMEDRILLNQYFKVVGGRYLSTLNSSGNGSTAGNSQTASTESDDPELSLFKTSLPQIEMNKKLVLNVEKDFSDKRYDIRIFEIKIKHKPNEKKYQFEMFATDQPQVMFRADFLSQSQQQGKKLMIERFNVIQQLHQDFEENKYMKDGMVLGILEQGFPHSVTFMLLEPVSHIQWQHVIADDKLNPIENRKEKEYFIKHCKDLIESGLWFNQVFPTEQGLNPVPQDIVKELPKLGYQKNIDAYTRAESIELFQGNLKTVFVPLGTIDQSGQLLIYQRQVEVTEGIFADVTLHSEGEFGTLRLAVTTSQNSSETSFVVEAKRESSRFLAGFLQVTERVKVFFTIEASTGYTEQERAYRVIVREPKLDKKLIDVVLSEKHIINIQSSKALAGFGSGQLSTFNVHSLREEVQYSFNTGFRDSFALFQKLPEIVSDFRKAFIVNEERLRFQSTVDSSRVLYRKVVTLPLPRGQTFIIFVKCDQLARVDVQFKVILFEQATSYEEQFLFETQQILTKDELAIVNSAIKAGNEKGMRDLFGKVVDRRLKIRNIGEDMLYVTPSEESKERFVAYFIEASAIAPEGPA